MNTTHYDPKHEINQTIRRLAFYFSFDLFIACIAAAIYLGETPAQVLAGWWTIQTSPCPLVTDYFMLGSLSAAFLNAAVCGSVCACLLLMHGAKYKPNVWAGYFLVIAHCFYGLNLVNMSFPMLGFFLYCRLHRLRFRDNLDWAMFITSFGPFFSEVLFRYPLTIRIPVALGSLELNLFAVFLCMLMAIYFGITVPALLPGTSKLHRGFNLYNGGLATGLFGLFVYAFMYRTMGRELPATPQLTNAVYEAHGRSYMLFCCVFFVLLFSACLLYGWFLNGKSFQGYGALLADSGHKTNFPLKYGIPLTWVNLGFYGLMMTAYFALVVSFTDGAGFTGATCGIIFAAMTFAASGQHPKNVWPILLGYAALSLLVTGLCMIEGRPVPWTLSTQGYMNGLAFATGLCPFVGVYGKKAGVTAGFMSAVMCTTTSAMHGGFVLYNGGLTAGITALILLPIMDTYEMHSERWGRSA